MQFLHMIPFSVLCLSFLSRCLLSFILDLPIQMYFKKILFLKVCPRMPKVVLSTGYVRAVNFSRKYLAVKKLVSF